MALAKLTRASLSDLAYDQVRGEILSGQFAPGERTSVVAIAESLGISRSPVRAAVERLEVEGLLVLDQGGVGVADTSLEDMLQLLDLRASLEGLAARRAAPRITADVVAELGELHVEFERAITADDPLSARATDLRFHQLIQEHSGNRWLAQALRQVQARVIVATYSKVWTHEQRAAVAEHHRILEALRAGDPDRSADAATDHLVRLMARIRDAQESVSEH